MSIQLTEIEAAIRVRMSPQLLRWFTSYAPKHGSKRKLPFTEVNGEYFYDDEQLHSFDAFLKEKWAAPPSSKRPTVPTGIEQEIIIEADHKCAFCQYIAHGEGAHIDPVSRSGCNHPHNLIWTCPNHHTEYDNGLKVATLVKPGHVKVVKEMLMDTQLRRWRVELRLVNALVSAIAELNRLKDYLSDPSLAEIKDTIRSQTMGVIAFVQAEAAKPAQSQQGSEQSALTGYRVLLERIAAQELTTKPTASPVTAPETCLRVNLTRLM